MARLSKARLNKALKTKTTTPWEEGAAVSMSARSVEGGSASGLLAGSASFREEEGDAHPDFQTAEQGGVLTSDLYLCLAAGRFPCDAAQLGTAQAKVSQFAIAQRAQTVESFTVQTVLFVAGCQCFECAADTGEDGSCVCGCCVHVSHFGASFFIG